MPYADDPPAKAGKASATQPSIELDRIHIVTAQSHEQHGQNLSLWRSPLSSAISVMQGVAQAANYLSATFFGRQCFRTSAPVASVCTPYW